MTVPHKVTDLIVRIRRQLQVNNSTIKQSYPESPLVNDQRLDIGVPHTIEILNSHITDHLNELETLLQQEFNKGPRIPRQHALMMATAIGFMVLLVAEQMLFHLLSGNYLRVVLPVLGAIVVYILVRSINKRYDTFN